MPTRDPVSGPNGIFQRRSNESITISVLISRVVASLRSWQRFAVLVAPMLKCFRLVMVPSLSIAIPKIASDEMNAQALPFGILPSFHSDPPEHLHLHSGDLVLLATDGFFEWENDQGEQFGVLRMEESIRSSRDLASGRDHYETLRDSERVLEWNQAAR